MKILIVDDDNEFLSGMPSGDGEFQTEMLQVSWEEDSSTHASALDAARDIQNHGPDAVFLDHTLGYKSAGQWRGPETGKDVARVLRDLGFTGLLLSTSSEKQTYCDAYCGKKALMETTALSTIKEYANGVHCLT